MSTTADRARDDAARSNANWLALRVLRQLGRADIVLAWYQIDEWEARP